MRNAVNAGRRSITNRSVAWINGWYLRRGGRWTSSSCWVYDWEIFSLVPCGHSLKMKRGLGLPDAVIDCFDEMLLFWPSRLCLDALSGARSVTAS